MFDLYSFHSCYKSWVYVLPASWVRLAFWVRNESSSVTLKNTYSATTRTGALGWRLSNHTLKFLKTNDSQVFLANGPIKFHEFQGCFLRRQVGSNGFKVFNGWSFAKKLENLLHHNYFRPSFFFCVLTTNNNNNNLYCALDKKV